MVMQFEYPRNALLDLSPINDAIDFRAKQQQRAKDNQFRDEQLGMQKEEFGLKKQGMEDARQKAFVQKAAGIAQMISQEKDPNVASARWGQLVNSDPRWGNALKASGVDPNDFRTGAQMIIAEARGYQDPLDAEKTQAQIGLVKAQTNLANVQASTKESPDQIFRIREREADRLGIQGPARTSFIATGKMGRDEPLSAGDRKAIREADDELVNVDAQLKLLEEAKSIGDKTNAGLAAGTRAWVANRVGMDDEQSLNTERYQSIIRSGAIQEMSKTLKGATTDKEMQEFINIAGDVSQPWPIRKRYIDAMAAKLKAARDVTARQSEEIRTGTYYKPQGQQQQPSPGAGQWSIKRLD